jgi:hypothetical protein
MVTELQAGQPRFDFAVKPKLSLGHIAWNYTVTSLQCYFSKQKALGRTNLPTFPA